MLLLSSADRVWFKCCVWLCFSLLWVEMVKRTDHFLESVEGVNIRMFIP